MNIFRNHLLKIAAKLNPIPKDIPFVKGFFVMLMVRFVLFSLLSFVASLAFKKYELLKYINKGHPPQKEVVKSLPEKEEVKSLPKKEVVRSPEDILRRDYETEIRFDINDAIGMGIDSRLQTPHRSGLLNKVIERLKEFRAISGGTIINKTFLSELQPVDAVVYESMIITELLMEQSHAAQYKDTSSNTQDSQDNDPKLNHKPSQEDIQTEIDDVSHLLIETLQKNEKKLRNSRIDIKSDTYTALLAIKKIYDTRIESKETIQPTYADEFLKNINVILYMIYKEDFKDIDINFISKIKEQFSVCFSDKENVDLVKKDDAITIEQSERSFLKTFKEITK